MTGCPQMETSLNMKYFPSILLVSLLVTLLVVGCNGPSSYKEIAQQFAPLVENIGLANFAKVDANYDGVIDERELVQASQSNAFGESERTVFAHMYTYRSWIGHVIDSQTETVPVTNLYPMPDGNGGFWYMPITSDQTHTTYFYGISKDDLATYRQRLKNIN